MFECALYVIVSISKAVQYIEMSGNWRVSSINKATPYNLKKYAQVLVYNRKPIEAKQQLFVLNQLYKKKMGLAEIIELNRRVK